jgi:hypothetical protein
MDYAQLLEDRGDLRAAMHHWKSAAEIGKAAALSVSAYRKGEKAQVESGLSVS